MMTSLSRDPIVDDEQLEAAEESPGKGGASPHRGAVGAALETLRVWLMQLSTFPRDLRALYRYIRLKVKIHRAQKNDLSVPKVFQEIVRKHPNKVAFYFEDETWTFTQVDEYSSRVGNYFASRGVKHGDSVAVFMENCVEYVCLWLGLCKIGAVPALINFNLKDDPLSHCIRIANCKAVICGKETQSALNELKDEEIRSLPHYVANASAEEISVKDAVNLDAALATADSGTPPQLKNVGFIDKMVYIYTSGTTGMPKAAVIKHSRGILAVIAGETMIDLWPDDIVYSPLPLYHLAAGILGSGQAIVGGITVVLKRKFSVSAYWKDCVKYRVTVRAIACQGESSRLYVRLNSFMPPMMQLMKYLFLCSFVLP